MSATILKPFNHLYKLFKIYLALSLLGVLLVLTYGVFSRYPDLGAILMTASIVVYFGTKMIQRVLRVRAEPPFYAEFILYLCLPSEAREAIIGDLTEAYYRMVERHDRSSLQVAVWFWRQVMLSIWCLLKWQLRRGYTMRLSKDINFNLRQVLPFYPEYKKTSFWW